MLLLFDNYDSFTYNIAQLLMQFGKEVDVVRNDAVHPEELLARNYEAIVLSPGPGIPKDAGYLEDLIRSAEGHLPMLGICLGHQAIGEVYGGKIIHAGEIVHGKSARLKHCEKGLYKGIPQGMEVGRYHSLIVEKESLPDTLEVTSELENGMIMGLRHKVYDVEGIQFHPESILTPQGERLMKNFLERIV